MPNSRTDLLGRDDVRISTLSETSTGVEHFDRESFFTNHISSSRYLFSYGSKELFLPRFERSVDITGGILRVGQIELWSALEIGAPETSASANDSHEPEFLPNRMDVGLRWLVSINGKPRSLFGGEGLVLVGLIIDSTRHRGPIQYQSV